MDSLPINQGRFLDLFAGGSSISFEAKNRGFEVITNDALYSSFVVNKALIENKSVKLSEKEILKFNSITVDSERRASFSWLENNLFYTTEVDELVKLIVLSENMRGYKKYLLQALIRRAMIRKLPYSRMNIDWKNILKLRDENYSYEKYGRRRAYHNDSFINHILRDLPDYNAAIFDNNCKNKVYQLDALDAIKKTGKVDIIYLDPPYPSTMNNYDGFYGKFDKIFGKKIEYTDITHEKDFLYYFDQLIDLASQYSDYLVVSLNTSGKIIFENLVDKFSFYGLVEIKEKKHNYQISGKESKNKNKELLAIVKFYK
ncbi:DNA adenine methylase [Lactococcus lactis]|uniref:DNA adenine methylase n=1 Tax=Lactococcus lactis TaxID=1358 RepID=UPI00211D93A8|nr:DNA adenine methylase [Lactococcus lactis]